MDVRSEQNLPQKIYLKDYKEPAYWVDQIDLKIDLGDEETLVTNRMSLRRNDGGLAASAERIDLNGVDQNIQSLHVNGKSLSPDEYEISGEVLRLPAGDERYEIEVVTKIRPQDNKSLEGLYMSHGMFCTQCEAEGFRKITYFPDRPDIMSAYRTTITADKAKYPVLLSNGNLIEEGELEGGRHFAVWEDPHRKPSYLFAMVAGDLAVIEDRHVTASGRDVTLRIFVEHGDEGRCDWAMLSLKKSMKWDEERYGLEYDLDIFMIVAVSHFNMGAMENKGLNIFNSSCVLADRDSATDGDFQVIESIVAHEYFHNWTGNRVTCRDWFQLSLKEGLTVFRDQQFSADMNDESVQRINDVLRLRAMQFPEDAGPMAHPVRPDEYAEINNFYTVTIYEKGAEVIRMIHSLVGEEGFRAGMELYFERHDGTAATTDDFAAAMADANGLDLEQFKLWYSQAGTPAVRVSGDYDAEAETYALTVSQTVPDTPGQTGKRPMTIPLEVGLIGPDGAEVPLRLVGDNDDSPSPTSKLLKVEQARQTFTFQGVKEAPIPSLLRGFSAPVKLTTDLSPSDLSFLLANDTDPFVKWDSGQQLATSVLLGLVDKSQSGARLELDNGLNEAIGTVLADSTLDPAIRAQIITLPGEGLIAQSVRTIDVDAIHHARSFVQEELSKSHRETLLALYHEMRTGGDSGDLSAPAMARRALANTALSYLCATGEAASLQLAKQQADQAESMTNVISALAALNDHECAERTDAMQAFHDRWKDDPLVLDKWFALQATAVLPNTLDRVRDLLDHPGFELTNPNRVRALIGRFAAGNSTMFHAKDGSGHRFVADLVLELDGFNPQIAARMITPFSRWRQFDEARSTSISQQLQAMRDRDNLSGDLNEMVSRALDG